MPVYLIGGGWRQDALELTYGPFVRSAAAAREARVACVVADGDGGGAEAFERWRAALAAVGAPPAFPVLVSEAAPLDVADLEGAGGVLVCGGLTPAYHDALRPQAARLAAWLRGRGIAYAGFSAGAAVAADVAVVGGWKADLDGRSVEVCAQEVAEDREDLDVRPGLGLVPFAVDVHASQWGTLTRLLTVVERGHAREGWAIDEDTMVEVGGGVAAVHGLGRAYRVRRAGGALEVEPLVAGDRRDLGGAPA